MKPLKLLSSASLALVLGGVSACGSPVVAGMAARSQAAPPSTFPRDAVASALQAPLTVDDGVYEASIPRDDLDVSRHGMPIHFDQDIELGFLPRTEKLTLLMGEIATTQAEQARLVPALLANGISVTAVHNHITQLRPAIQWVHFMANADAVDLAKRIHRVLRHTTGTEFPVAKGTTSTPLPVRKMARTLGGTPSVEDADVVQVAVDRRDEIQQDGVTLPPPMGVNALVYFQPLRHGRAATTGEMCVTAGEVQQVLRALQARGLTVTALHSHMLDTSPATYFVHWFGKGSPMSLATKVRAALDQADYTREN